MPKRKPSELQRRHPRLYATRHVAGGIAKALVPLLGVGALIGLLLPRLDIPWPDLDLPSLSLPGWLDTLLSTAKFWVPVLIGVLVAIEELERHHKKRRAP